MSTQCNKMRLDNSIRRLLYRNRKKAMAVVLVLWVIIYKRNHLAARNAAADYPGTFRLWLGVHKEGSALSSVTAVNISSSVLRKLCDKSFWYRTLQLSNSDYIRVCEQSNQHAIREILHLQNADFTFIRALERYSSSNGDIILSAVDYAFIDMTLNFYLTSLKKFNITNYLFLVMDTKSQDILRQHNINCFYYRINESTELASFFKTKAFNCKCNSRILYMLQALLLGYNVLQVDVDVVFLKSPWPYLHEACNASSCDIAFQWDNFQPNAGFMYAKKTSSSVIVFLTLQHKIARDVNCDIPDQIYLYKHILYTKLMPVQLVLEFVGLWWRSVILVGLSEKQFQSGLQFFVKEKRYSPALVKSCRHCVVLHNNYIIGKAAKINRFKAIGLWEYDGQEHLLNL